MADQIQTVRRGRLDELDYLKCVMVVLMVSFHLVHISDTYPYAKQVVYTFHMPVFLVLSGYLMNVGKTAGKYLHTMLFYFIPYVVMESGYTLMASVLPIREHIDQLTPLVFLDKLFVSPLGPYWYLHTLILCGLTYYGVFRLQRLTLLSRWIVMGLAFAFYALLAIQAGVRSAQFAAYLIHAFLGIGALRATAKIRIVNLFVHALLVYACLRFRTNFAAAFLLRIRLIALQPRRVLRCRYRTGLKRIYEQRKFRRFFAGYVLVRSCTCRAFFRHRHADMLLRE